MSPTIDAIDVPGFWSKGYTIVPGLFAAEEIERIRAIAHATVGVGGDLLTRPDLRFVLTDGRLIDVARRLLGVQDILYIGDSSVSYNGTQKGWHKDNTDRKDPDAPDWAGRYTQLRFGLYCQDHVTHTGGLNLRAGSHDIVDLTSGECVYVQTRPGDLAVWNMRITHSGNGMLLKDPGAPFPLPHQQGSFAEDEVAPQDGDRIALFAHLGADDAHGRRYGDYLKTRTYIVDAFRAHPWDAEARQAAADAALVLRDVPAEVKDDPTAGLNELWQPMPDAAQVMPSTPISPSLAPSTSTEGVPPRVAELISQLEYTMGSNPSLLEIGSGDGANLAALRSKGFTDVTGIERSRRAVSRLRADRPELAGARVLIGRPHRVLSDVPDDSFQVAFALGGLHQLRGDKAFAAIGRVASTVISIDPADARRDVAAALGPAGFAVRKQVPMSTDPTQIVTVLRRMQARSTLYEFWRQEQPHGNEPQAYLRPVHRSKALLELISDLPQTARILEVGCNVGRNLAYLHDHGYPNVRGIEISPHAVELLRTEYPQLADCPVQVGPAGDHLPGFADDSLDLVFTMAVIEHLHPDEATPVFDAMARVAPNVLAIEPANRLSHRQYPHDVPAEFEKRGMTLVSSPVMHDLIGDADDPAMTQFRAYRFVRSGS